MDEGRNPITDMFIRVLPRDLGQPAHGLQRPRKKKHVLATNGTGTEHQRSGGSKKNT